MECSNREKNDHQGKDEMNLTKEVGIIEQITLKVETAHARQT